MVGLFLSSHTGGLDYFNNHLTTNNKINLKQSTTKLTIAITPKYLQTKTPTSFTDQSVVISNNRQTMCLLFS